MTDMNEAGGLPPEEEAVPPGLEPIEAMPRPLGAPPRVAVGGEEPEKTTDWTDTIGASIESSLAMDVWEWGKETLKSLEPDLNYSFEEHLPDIKERVPEYYWGDLLPKLSAQAISREHADMLVDRYLEQKYAYETLDKQGTAGKLLSFGMQFLDPANLALGMATGGIGMTGSVGGRILRGAAGGAATGAGTQALVNTGNLGYDPADIWMAGIAAGVFGGGFAGMLGRARPGTMAQQAGAENASVMARMTDELAAAGDSVGAARATPEDIVAGPLREQADDLTDFLNRYPEAATTMRFDTAGTYGNSAFSKQGRVMHDMIFKDVLGKKGDEVAEGYAGATSAFERAEYNTELREGRLARGTRDSFKAWAKERGRNFPNYKDMSEFGREVSYAYRTGQGSPEALRAAEALRAEIRGQFNDAAENGVRGFGTDFQFRDDYLPQLPQSAKFSEASRRYSLVGKNSHPDLDGPVEEAVFKAVRSRRPNEDVIKQVRLAKNYTKLVRMRGTGVQSVHMGNSSLNAVRESLEDLGMSADEVAEVIEMVQGRGSKAVKGEGKIDRAKKRTDLDLDVEVRVRDLETGDIKDMPLRDLYEQDAFVLGGKYFRQVGGMSAMAQRTRGTPMEITSQADFERHINNIRMQAESIGADAVALADKQIEQLERGWKLTMGQAIHDNSKPYVHALRFAKAMQVATKLGKVIFPQATEYGKILAGMNFRELVQHMPFFRSFRNMVLQAAKQKKPDAQLIEDLQFFGVDYGWDTYGNRLRFDEFTEGLDLNATLPVNTGVAGVRQLPVRGMAVAGHYAQKPVVYLMQKLTDLQAHAATRVQLQKWANFANSFRKMTDAQRKRMHTNGMNDEMIERVMNQVRKHFETQGKGFRKGTLRALNLDKWTDLEARDALIYATRRETRRQILQADPGSTPAWMSSSIGSAIGQFRSFMVNAYHSQLLHGLQHRDWETYYGAALTTFFGSMQWGARIALGAYGTNKAYGYLEEKLGTWDDPNWENWMKAGVSSAGWSSMIPFAVDTIADLFGDPIFDNGYRSSGLQAGLLNFNNVPVIDYFNQIFQSLEAIGESATSDERQFNQRDYNGLLSLMPMNNIAIIENAMRHLGTRMFPESKKQGEL